MTRLTSLVAKSLLTILLGCGIFAGNLQAQIDPSMTATIPFPFTISTHSIPPGTYRFTLASDSFLLSVVDVKTGHERLFIVRPVQDRAIEQKGRLLFHDSRGSSALNEVHFPGTVLFSEVVEGHDGQRMEAKRSSTGDSIAVAQR